MLHNKMFLPIPASEDDRGWIFEEDVFLLLPLNTVLKIWEAARYKGKDIILAREDGFSYRWNL